MCAHESDTRCEQQTGNGLAGVGSDSDSTTTQYQNFGRPGEKWRYRRGLPRRQQEESFFYQSDGLCGLQHRNCPTQRQNNGQF